MLAVLTHIVAPTLALCKLRHIKQCAIIMEKICTRFSNALLVVRHCLSTAVVDIRLTHIEAALVHGKLHSSVVNIYVGLVSIIKTCF
jgi:hypothetical protein